VPEQNLGRELTFSVVFSLLTLEFCASIIAAPKNSRCIWGVELHQPIIAGTQTGLVIQGKDS
jgi:hypothetical protein